MSAAERVRAFAAGLAGAAAMMAVSRATGVGVMAELQQLAGTFALPPGPASRALGFGAQLINGGLLAQVYLEAFKRIPAGANWKAGLGLGLVHGAVAGGLLSAVPALHPRVPAYLPAPGPFMANRGARAAVAFIALHGLFGGIVGATTGRRR